MMQCLFVAIMSIGRQYEDYDLRVVNLIDETVLLRNTPTPRPSAIPLGLFRFSRSCERMLFQFFYQFFDFAKRPWLVEPQSEQVIFSLFSKINRISCHYPTLSKNSSNVSPGSMRCTFPSRACWRDSSIRAKNSSCVNFVGSACFSATSLRRYFAARFIRFSSSAMMLMLRSISAFSCTAVITILFCLQK